VKSSFPRFHLLFLYGSTVSGSYFTNRAVNTCQKSYFYLCCFFVVYKCPFCVFYSYLFEKCLVYIKARTDHPDKYYGNYPLCGIRRLLLRLETCMFFRVFLKGTIFHRNLFWLHLLMLLFKLLSAEFGFKPFKRILFCTVQLTYFFRLPDETMNYPSVISKHWFS
jgi:hypothetical protein